MEQEEQLQFTRLPKLPKFTGDSGAEQFVKEIRLLLQLQPVPPASAVTWILCALEGRARQDILDRAPSEINTPDKLLRILVEKWGEQRDGTTLASAFYKRQQGLGETVEDYASNMRSLFALANTARTGILADDTLRDTFVQGLQPTALRRDVKAYTRLNTGSTFEDVVKEAQRWMREDFSDVAATAQLSATPLPDWTQLTQQLMAHIDQQVSAVADSLHQSIRQQRGDMDFYGVHCPPAPRQPSLDPRRHRQPALRQFTQPLGPSQRDTPTCIWCSRRGHLEDECQAKKRYVALQNNAPQQHPQQQPEFVRCFPSHTAVNRRITVKSIELTGELPTLDIALNGHQGVALIDTGSEVSTITETWASQHLGHLTLETGFNTLRAVNGDEVPYIGIVTADVQLLGQHLQNFPFLVVKTPNDLVTQMRKKEKPVLFCMNVLKRWLPHANQVPQFLASTVNCCDLKTVPKTAPVAESFSQLVFTPRETMTTGQQLNLCCRHVNSQQSTGTHGPANTGTHIPASAVTKRRTTTHKI